VPKSKPSTIRLQVFKGRESRLNKAIFQILAIKGPQTIYDIHKRAETQRGLRYTRYASVNKRVRSLEESGYVSKAAIKETKAGFEASLYELRIKAYLAMMLDSINLEYLLARVNETTASVILGILTDGTGSDSDVRPRSRP
jgi:hypothetical protein